METCETDNLKGLLQFIASANLVWSLDNLVKMKKLLILSF